MYRGNSTISIVLNLDLRYASGAEQRKGADG